MGEVITSGLFVVEPSSDSTPDELVPVQAGAHPRSETEVAGADVAAKGVRVVVVRLPLVYGREDHAGFTSLLISIARQKQESAYISDGEYLWPAVHQLDAAVLFRLVVDNATEDGPAHAVAEEGVLLREIAEVVGKRLNIPVVSKSVTEANEHFGWLARFMHNDKPRSSQWTQEKYAGSPSKLVYSPFSTAMLTFHDLDSLMALANTFLNRNNDWELILGKVLTTGTAALDFDNLL
ncbi:hypothetical protein AC1031_018896 [Aphanomyces cochlioides]|nr:hypothetical protein AC1031_018896 [Aphanomyces cochlioides]